MIRNRKKKLTTPIVFAVVFVLFIFTPLLRGIVGLADPLLARMGESVSYIASLREYFISKDILLAENRRLRASVSYTFLTDQTLITDKYPIVARPPFAGVDHIIARHNNVDTLDDRFTTSGDIILGRVSETRSTTFTIELLSRAGVTTVGRVRIPERSEEVLAGLTDDSTPNNSQLADGTNQITEHIQKKFETLDFEIIGRGAGDMRADIPQDALPSLIIGDPVYFAKDTKYLVGLVRDIIFDERDAIKTILISLPIHPNDMDSVSVLGTSN